MAWFRVDDNFYDHPKVDDLSLSAVGLWLLCGTYSARHLTDGHIPTRRAYRLGADENAIQELINAELWDEADDGYQFRNWDEYQFTRQEAESKRAYEREKKRNQRRNSKGQYTGRTNNVPEMSPGDTPGDSPHMSPGESPRESHQPDPTRPDPVSPNGDTPSSHVASDDDGKTKKEFPQEIKDIAHHLEALIKLNGNRVGKVGTEWYQAIDRLNRLDGYTPDQIRQVIDWSQQDEFWQGNIRSAKKLRQQFDQLKHRMFSERQKQSQPPAYMTATERKLAVGAERAQRLKQQSEQPEQYQNSILNIIQGEIAQ